MDLYCDFDNLFSLVLSISYLDVFKFFFFRIVSLRCFFGHGYLVWSWIKFHAFSIRWAFGFDFWLYENTNLWLYEFNILIITYCNSLFIYLFFCICNVCIYIYIYILFILENCMRFMILIFFFNLHELMFWFSYICMWLILLFSF